MKKICTRKIAVSEIFEFISNSFFDKEFYITGPSNFNNIIENSIVLLTDRNYDCLKEEKHHENVLFVSCKEIQGQNVLVTDTPELDFYKIINEFFMDDVINIIDENVMIENGARIGKNVSIGNNSFISGNVKIGNNCFIGKNVSIYGEVDIASNVIIKDNVVINTNQFGFILDDGAYIEKPSLGKTIIGKNVIIGNSSTIEQPLFGETIIGKNVKIDDLVNIGSESVIEDDVIISSGAVVCQNIRIGKNCQIGVNTSIKSNVNIVENTMLGMGSVVIENIDKEGKYAGNPIKLLERKGKDTWQV